MVKQKEDYALLLEEIQHKIYLVAKKNQFLREQNQVLQEEIDALKGLFRKKEIQITELKEKNIQMQGVLALQDPSEKSKSFHLKLEYLIREVDKCIGLLDN